MQVTTFYSYKGGLGRSLLLSWAARALAHEGQSVVAVDLDLEAPGLAFKLGLDEKDDWGPGVVGLLGRFLGGEPPPDSLEDWLIPVPESENLRLLPAGPAPSAEYWQALASISWDDLFFGPNPQGARFFTWLRESIEEAYQVDHLLVDARTGVTELGGAALSLMADQVLALLGTAKEGVLGTREVLRSVMSGLRPANRSAPRIGLVLARMPATLAASDLQRLRKVLRANICEEAEPLSATVSTGLPLVVRSEPSLQQDEIRALAETDLRVHQDYAAVLGWILGRDAPKEAQGIVYHPDQGIAELRAMIEMQRDAASREPETYLPELAASLENLAASLEGQGRLEHSVEASVEAVHLRRQLADDPTLRRREELANSLSNLSQRFDALGRWPDSVEAAREAVEIRISLAESNAPQSSTALAQALNILGAILSRIGDEEAAISSLQAATDIQRDLAETDAESTSILAAYLSNLGAFQGRFGRLEAARRSTEEAISTLRELDRSNVVLARLANSLSNLGVIDRKIGNGQAALRSSLEAVKLFRELLRLESDKHAPDLARSLVNLGILHDEQGKLKLALKSFEEAAARFRDLPPESSRNHRSNLADLLSRRTYVLVKMESWKTALEAAREALTLWQDLASRSPEVYTSELARVLDLMGTALAGVGKPDEARDAFQKGLRLILPKAEQLPTAHRDLTLSLRRGYSDVSETAEDPLLDRVSALYGEAETQD